MDHAAASRGGNCSIARYSAANNAYSIHNTTINMPSFHYIMRRFRPIAPKPTTSTGSNKLLATTADGSTSSINAIRTRPGKRKAAAFARCNRGKKVTTTPKTTTLLPLLPETRRDDGDGRRRDDDDSPSSGSWSNSNCNSSSDLAIWWNLEGDDDLSRTAHVQVMMPRPVRVAGSIVTVESVMDTWGGGGDDATVLMYGLGCTDEERMMRLEMDACPCFVSDGGDGVVWTNEAYKDMVGLHAQDEMRVLLAMKGGIMAYGRAFSCRVRMQYARGKDRCSLTLPCDVWRMEFGGYAWRLDVKAALSLGR